MPERLFNDNQTLGRGAAPVWSWLPSTEIEEGALAQIRNLATLPSAVHVAVMPDVHKGYGMPIGCALATEGTVVPYAVGVDIGCGMIAQPLGIPAEGLPLKAILDGILERVPVGQPSKTRGRDAGSFTTRQDSAALRDWAAALSTVANHGQAVDIRERADRQLGTLGGGNHFVELQADQQNMAWLMLHTGSRSFGYAICTFWHARAIEWCERYHTVLPDKDLAFLSLDSDDGQGYMADMEFAMRFAEESRLRILAACMESITAVTGHRLGWDNPLEANVSTHHNFAAREQHMGRDVVVHRKGAVATASRHRQQGFRVTIPGSMQTGSYIGRGLENALALNTCAHGAGRRLRRNEARRQNVGVDIRSEMEAAGLVLVTPEGADTLDEAGRAYKDIESVMQYQADLVTPTVKLRPLGTVKG